MFEKRVGWFLVVAFFCVALVGCAGIPKEELDEKEAVISNLNGQLNALRGEIARLEQSNRELMSANSELEGKIGRLEDEIAQLKKLSLEKKPKPETESDIK
ncbi:MAG: hypothetical protein HY589_01600 [Candidatus Omnitrophica bacterium]|nr:hypothetical protein [Candidatus Omnitrophota bacterium]